MYLLLFILLVTGIFLISLKRPEALIALTFCMFGVETYFTAKDTFFLNNSSFVNIVIMLALCGRVAFAVGKGERISPVKNTTWRIAMLLLAFAVFSGLWTRDVEQFQTNWKRGAPYVLIYLFLVPALLRTPQIARSTLLWTVGIGSVTALLLYFTCDWEVRGVVVAGQGQYSSERDTSAILAIAQLGGTIAIIAALVRAKKSKSLTLARWALVALGLILTIRTGSRGQTIFAIACIALFLPINNRSMSFKGLVFSILSLAVFGAVAYYLFDNFATHGRWNSTMKSLEGRQVMWEAMLQYWLREGPLAWVAGLGSASSYKYVGFYIHNVPLEILFECGLVGAALYIRMCYETGKHVATGVRLANVLDKERFNMLVVYTALFTFEVLCTLKSGSLFGQQLFILYAISIETTMRGWKADPIQYQQREYQRQYQPHPQLR